ncbi:DUF488 domain-containing protein [Simplicispira piscis]
MPLRIVRLGSPRAAGEGTRIGTVRRPPRGVPKAEFASRDYYDVWYPLLSPSPEAMAQGQQAQTDKEWEQFVKQFRKELAQPEASRTLDLLAALSQHSALSVGCYCEDEARCHRSVLRAELLARGADVAP